MIYVANYSINIKIRLYQKEEKNYIKMYHFAMKTADMSIEITMQIKLIANAI